MKKFILCLTVSAFAIASSVLADNNVASPKAAAEKTACCQGKSCCEKKDGCSSKSASACTKGMPSRHVLMTPKAAVNSGKS